MINKDLAKTISVDSLNMLEAEKLQHFDTDSAILLAKAKIGDLKAIKHILGKVTEPSFYETTVKNMLKTAILNWQPDIVHFLKTSYTRHYRLHPSFINYVVFSPRLEAVRYMLSRGSSLKDIQESTLMMLPYRVALCKKTREEREHTLAMLTHLISHCINFSLNINDSNNLSEDVGDTLEVIQYLFQKGYDISTLKQQTILESMVIGNVCGDTLKFLLTSAPYLILLEIVEKCIILGRTEMFSMLFNVFIERLQEHLVGQLTTTFIYGRRDMAICILRAMKTRNSEQYTNIVNSSDLYKSFIQDQNGIRVDLAAILEVIANS